MWKYYVNVLHIYCDKPILWSSLLQNETVCQNLEPVHLQSIVQHHTVMLNNKSIIIQVQVI